MASKVIVKSVPFDWLRDSLGRGARNKNHARRMVYEAFSNNVAFKLPEFYTNDFLHRYISDLRNKQIKIVNIFQ